MSPWDDDWPHRVPRRVRIQVSGFVLGACAYGGRLRTVGVSPGMCLCVRNRPQAGSGCRGGSWISGNRPPQSHLADARPASGTPCSDERRFALRLHGVVLPALLRCDRPEAGNGHGQAPREKVAPPGFPRGHRSVAVFGLGASAGPIPIGDRVARADPDLIGAPALSVAAGRAYRMAGVRTPAESSWGVLEKTRAMLAAVAALGSQTRLRNAQLGQWHGTQQRLSSPLLPSRKIAVSIR